ncbi:hypothetical protein WOLCODRAFT_141572 [Wolfiporia cocos MD-104 SS10]|uniref:Uncharacterized protein n=1 Tax=Wolfiporia cocos (strain MD-104) TaxID=742152 RepID=A0A2H3ITD9_WOLCO|nr:hypothetical protein WOLCODRAFT_141572 [Wolfiporia cocos MD-104 SS10]
MRLVALLIAILSSSIGSHFVSATILLNVTVDDTIPNAGTGDKFVYAGSWNLGQDCSGCVAHPDAEFAYYGTWHDSTYLPSTDATTVNASLSFNGTALYVYCIVFHSSDNPDGYTNLWFYLDDEQVGNFTQVPSGNGANVSYNVLVYDNDRIPWGTHTFTLVNGDPSGQASLVLLDYAIYTTQVDLVDVFKQPQTAITTSIMVTQTQWRTSYDLNKQTTAIVVSVCVVGVVFSIMFGVLAFYYRHHRRYSEYRPPMEGIFCGPRVKERDCERRSGWAADTWTSSQNVLRPNRKSHPSAIRSLLPFDPHSQRRQTATIITAEAAISTTSSSIVGGKPEEYDQVVVHAPSVRSGAPLPVVPASSMVDDIVGERMREEKPAEEEKPAQEQKLAPLVLHIPGPIRSVFGPDTPASKESPTPTWKLSPAEGVRPLPPIPPLPPMPTSEPPFPRPNSSRRSRAMQRGSRETTSPPTTDSGTDPGSRAWRQSASTRQSTMTTPTSMLPSGYFYASTPATPYLPARTDSVKTIASIPLVPNRHPEMMVPAIERSRARMGGPSEGVGPQGDENGEMDSERRKTSRVDGPLEGEDPQDDGTGSGGGEDSEVAMAMPKEGYTSPLKSSSGSEDRQLASKASTGIHDDTSSVSLR